MKRRRSTLAGIVLGCLPSIASADEGMFPISEIGPLNLPEHGLEMDPADIFREDGVCLVDGICRVNGCTGSFVSPEGLIFTNHHCAYRAIQSASSAQHDYLQDGFLAADRGQEIPAKGYTVRITESFRDVSAQVLAVVDAQMEFAERTRAIDKQRKSLEKAAEDEHPGMRAEVAEMFVGKTYVLFLYTNLRDIRLVFAPPQSVGTFGGAVDNWEWPRHTGDFSFLRAYVAPDGSPADHDEQNVPFRPKRHIPVAPEGVSEGDFVFLLGYPGRTARHKTSHFLQYEEEVRLPHVVELYRWQVAVMEEDGREDRAVLLKHLSRIQGLANVEKRSRGQLKGLAGARFVARRQESEKSLQQFIDSDDIRRERCGTILREIGEVYAEMTAQARFELNFRGLVRGCRLLSIANTLVDAAHERQKDDLERESASMDRNWPQTVARLKLSFADLHVPTDRRLLAGLLQRLAEVPQVGEVPALKRFAEQHDDPLFIERLYARARLTDADFLESCLDMNPEQLRETGAPFLDIAAALYPTSLELRERNKEREGRLSQLSGMLIEVKKEFLQADFVPDANSTLRLTFGRIRRYSPEDAVIKLPITTLGGVVAKTTGEEPFVTPQRILDLHAARDFGRYAHPELGDVPVGILYDTDTTGGNSGSPIINAKGQLVGVNFDRTFEATINDFAWHQSYSRSIGVDIRYALWVTDKVAGATHLIREMGLSE